VNPDPDDDAVTIENPTTGKVAMTRYLVDYLSESLAEAESYSDRDDTDDEDVDPLVAELEKAVTAAKRAREAAEADGASAADERLAEVGNRIDAIAEAVRERRDELSPRVLALLGRRIERARNRVEQAIDAPLK
jgi:acyl-CoA reductase-like NAD-dependent aldehyde dehydrogenase